MYLSSSGQNSVGSFAITNKITYPIGSEEHRAKFVFLIFLDDLDYFQQRSFIPLISCLGLDSP